MAVRDADSRTAPVAILSLQGTGGEPQHWPIGEGVLTLGRAKDCEISIADARLSRRHAELRCQGRRVTVADLGSVNGTFVNGKRIQQAHVLDNGDCVRVGPFEFLFQTVVPPEERIPERPTMVMDEPTRVPRLEVSSGPQRGHTFDLTGERAVVGRAGHGPQWDIMLQDRAVSRPHAEIVREGDGFLLTDLGSANGTLVNGFPLDHPHRLNNGDAITFGEAVLVFRAGEP